MKTQLAKDIIENLPKDRTLFEHYEDQHAVMLLQQATQTPVPISQLKQSKFSRLLQRPGISQVLAGKGDGNLHCDDLIYTPRQDVFNFVLTLGLWAKRRTSRSWAQTSRPGTNLVLQLNFDNEHDRAYEKLLHPIKDSPFSDDIHPVCQRGRTTMAWARIDLDFQSGEALIEEIQNDWVRQAMGSYAHGKELQKKLGMEKANNKDLYFCGDVVGSLPKLIEYVDTYLRQRAKHWSQAMMSAAIWFLSEEMGFKSIWFHDHETGNKLKRIDYNKPPTSIYTQLPKKFCFERTQKAPEFIMGTAQKKLQQSLKAGKESFWHLSL